MVDKIAVVRFAHRAPKYLLAVAASFAFFLVGLLGMVTFLGHYSASLVVDISPPAQTQPTEPLSRALGLPQRLKIPKLAVDAAVESLGLTPQGDLDAPKGFENVGWYNAGPRPGGIGSAVLDGHFGRSDNKPAVFDNLHTLQKGDLIYVEDEGKVVITFAVSRLVSYDPNDDARDVFLSSDGKAHLNLITCEGAWNKDQASYSRRLVVFADRVYKY